MKYCKPLTRLSMSEIQEDPFIQEAIDQIANGGLKIGELSSWARSQGVSEYVHEDHITWGDEIWKLTTPRQWELAKLAICNNDKEGKFTASAGNEIEHIFGGLTNRDKSQFKFGRHIHRIKGCDFHFMREARKIKDLPKTKIK